MATGPELSAMYYGGEADRVYALTSEPGFMDRIFEGLADANPKVQANAGLASQMLLNSHFAHQDHLPVVAFANRLAKLAPDVPDQEDMRIRLLETRASLFWYAVEKGLSRSPEILGACAALLDAAPNSNELAERILLSRVNK